MRTIVAAVQMTSKEDVAENLAAVRRLTTRAVERGARLVVLPENFAFLGATEEAKRPHVEAIPPEGSRIGDPSVVAGPILTSLAETARATGAWIIGGGMPTVGPADGGSSGGVRCFNSAVTVDPEGRLRAIYHKIHLFDVVTPDGTEYRESRTVAPGDRPRTVETPAGTVGLSICYDLRFPELYRRLAEAGAHLHVVPAAFTLLTGKDHWHVLLRARAVETGCYVVAAAQQGKHNDKRMTYGHTLIADPWGTVLAEAGDGEGLAVAEIDHARLEQVRRDLPTWQHHRI